MASHKTEKLPKPVTLNDPPNESIVENTEILQVLGDRISDAACTNHMMTSFETSDAKAGTIRCSG